MENSCVEISPAVGVELDADTINPEWVLEGSPTIRCSWWSSSTDGLANHYQWDSTAGRFRWYFSRDETVHIIDGEVEVSSEGGASSWLRAGDAALFRAGTWSTWYVPNYVRKHAVLHTKLPWPLLVQVRLGQRAKSLVRRALGRPTESSNALG